MNEPPQAIVFRGVDADEAEVFIQAIRQLAYREDKDDDSVWMARFATTCFRGRAMRWHAMLGVSVKKDWDLIVQAILEEWSIEVNDANSGEVAASNPPTPVGAEGQKQARPFAQLALGTWCTGRIRVVRDGDLTAGFLLARDHQSKYSKARISILPGSASLFRFVLSSTRTRIVVWDSSGLNTGYALTLNDSWKLGAGCPAWGVNPSVANGLDIWKLSSDGTLSVSWTGKDSVPHSSSDFAVSMYGFEIIRAAISTPQMTNFPEDYYGARLVFEQTV